MIYKDFFKKDLPRFIFKYNIIEYKEKNILNFTFIEPRSFFITV